MRIEGRAFAKVNLGLRILDRRPDGFHELRTVFQTVSLSDRVAVEFEPARRTKIELTVSDATLAGPDNLAWKAAEALLGRSRRRGRVRIELDKRIPAGAGLGGGSADAGAVLLALSRLFDPPPSALELQLAAEHVGSDVPFFLLGGRAVGAGRGEEVYALPDELRRPLLIVCPAAHISTKHAYQALARSRRGALTADDKRFMLSSFCSGVRVPGAARRETTEAEELAGALTNDFEDVIFRRFPELGEYKERLERAGGKPALMSGSGSALFGMFEDRGAALAARRFFEGEALRTFVVRTVSRREYAGVWGR
jgi:4-diphosphocytidyl-2-C-methyl-D-erythritol kinase